ncbi:HAD-IA family hydrolase [Candidatus Spongiihabitans sp.]|uniref:HAD-IA family hydrolase n=1 Tax=Candidatus Spongiihabitans sp. TaxID=3101308 RepID=UPI003C6FC597
MQIKDSTDKLIGRPAQFALFDMDGLLLDTEIIYTQVTQSIVGRFGKTFDWSIKGNMIGLPAMVAANYLVGALQLPISAEIYLAERDQLLRAKFPSCKAMPGAENLIRNLDSHNIPIAVATSSSRELFQSKTSNHQDWFKLFNIVVTGDDAEVKQGKPAPDIFNVAAKRLDANPRNTLVFEDAPSGLAAGIAAGMRVIVVPDPNMDKSRYRRAERILNSLEEFNPAEFGLLSS